MKKKHVSLRGNVTLLSKEINGRKVGMGVETPLLSFSPPLVHRLARTASAQAGR
jgi:hypothetical protein